MKLPSHLAKSRHGIFYFRLTFRVGTTIKEKRISLRTKNPQEARIKASCLSGIMTAKKLEQERAATRDTITTAQSIAGNSMGKDLLWEILNRFDRGQLAQLSGLPLSEVNDLFNPPEDAQENVHKLDIEMPGGLVLRNIQNDEDTSRAIQILTALNLTQDAITKLAAGPNPQPKTVEPVVAQEVIPTAQAGTTIQEMVPRFATRKKNKLSPKALYEYDAP